MRPAGRKLPTPDLDCSPAAAGPPRRMRDGTHGRTEGKGAGGHDSRCPQDDALVKRVFPFSSQLYYTHCFNEYCKIRQYNVQMMAMIT
jgi:hypothetical protein